MRWFNICCELCYSGLKAELQCPGGPERQGLSKNLPDYIGCIGFIDRTLIEISRPSAESRADQQQLWNNGRKLMYCFNNTVIVDHFGLFIFIDPSYPGSIHDVKCLRKSEFFKKWRRYFTHTEEYFEYLLGDYEADRTAKKWYLSSMHLTLCMQATEFRLNGESEARNENGAG